MAGADAQLARAIALEDSGKPEEALGQYRQILAATPQHADALHNRGLLLVRLGRFAEAEHSHQEYIQRCPDDPRAHGDLADVLLALGRYEESLAALSVVLRLRPQDATARVRCGVALACMARFAEAREAFAEAQASDPQEVARFVGRVVGGSLQTALSPENIYFARRWQAQGQCDWRDWDGYVAAMRRAASDPDVALEPAIGFMSQHAPLSDVERHALMRRIAALIETRLPALPHAGPRQRQRIRVGVMSPDYREHLNAYLLRPLFELADRKRFEMYAYSLMPDDGGPSRARIRAAADAFRDLHTLSDQEAALAIRRDDVDILVDAGGHTIGGRFAITAQRPARVQVNWLGFPSSLGSRRVDYAIVDRVAAPDEASWSEQLVHLPSTFFLYDFRGPPPVSLVSRRDYGLPENAFVFCANHKAEKVTPDALRVWMEIMRQVPRSVLWLSGMPAAAGSNLRIAAQAQGVDPARLFFPPFDTRDRYLARQRLGDLMLDAFVHSALTTACDALGMGLPVLTRGGGAAFSSRAGESIGRAAGVPELVAANTEEYVGTALRLASDPSALRLIRQRLERRSAPLFDTAGQVRELEAAFERML